MVHTGANAVANSHWPYQLWPAHTEYIGNVGLSYCMVITIPVSVFLLPIVTIDSLPAPSLSVRPANWVVMNGPSFSPHCVGQAELQFGCDGEPLSISPFSTLPINGYDTGLVTSVGRTRLCLGWTGPFRVYCSLSFFFSPALMS